MAPGETPRTQKVVEVHEYNVKDPAAAVRLAERPVREPEQGEVCVKMLLRPVNPADIFSVQGGYPGFKPSQLPAVPGLDGVGVVERCGPGTGALKPGQRVVGAPFDSASGNGTWQQYVTISEGKLLPVPDGMSDDVASQFFVNPVTAVGFFDTLKVPKGEFLLNNAATSALGRMVISLAKHHGVKTINLVRRRDAVQELKDAGADEVLVLGEDDIPERVKEITGGRGAYAALEPVGGKVTMDVVAATRDSGEVLIYGALTGGQATFAIPDLLFRDVRLHGFWLSHWLRAMEDDAARRRALDEVMDLLEKGVLLAGGGEHLPLDRVADAIRATSEPGRPKVFLEG